MDEYQAKKEFEASLQRMYAEGQLTAKEAFAAEEDEAPAAEPQELSAN